MADVRAYRLFGTSGCHLCEKAEALVQSVVLPGCWHYVDIADDDRLSLTYGTRVPVLRHEISGAELDWPFGLDELARFLAADVVSIPPNPFPSTVIGS